MKLKHGPMTLILYILMGALFLGTAYFVKRQTALTEQRSRASQLETCDVEIDIVPDETATHAPTATQVPAATATQSPTPTQSVAAQQAEPTPAIPDVSCNGRANLVIAIDRSTSMGEKDSSGKTKLERAKIAAKTFVTAIAESGSQNIKISIISLGGDGADNATRHIELSTNYNAVMAAIDQIGGVKPWTCLECGVRFGNSQVSSATDSKAFIVLSDGNTNGTPAGLMAAIAQANTGRSRGIAYYALGFGTASGEVNLSAINSFVGSNGQLLYRPDPKSWAQGFLDLLPKFCSIAP